MPTDILLITPAFTQLNTPYPATAYLKGFLKTLHICSEQTDLGIEVTLAIFCKTGLQDIFKTIVNSALELSPNAQRMVALREDYIYSIDAVILFLQGRNATLADRICQRDFLPEAARFAQTDDLQWAFGNMGTQDKAKHIATLYLEDLADLIAECVDEHFGFSRYAERLGRSANNFDELYHALQQPLRYIDAITIGLLQQHLQKHQPKLVALSVPFPGNLYSSLRCAQFIKLHFPHIKVAMGGGFANTELREITDVRVFEFYDFITLDDGEAPIENLLKYIDGHIAYTGLKRTFLLRNGEVVFINNEACGDYKQGQVGTPDYDGLLLNHYISAIEVANPMHRMWSDGRWNKLTMAHGCYWGKCTFCDTSLDYIQRYEPLTAGILVNRMEEMIAQTGGSGFHFVDEAAPPALMRSLALEIIGRRLTVTWWTNVRFEKSFTKDLCILLKASGCIAVSGGLEVAGDRLLQLIQKGITVAQVAQVNKNFTEAGIMVHAYLMYGFPTQTAQETIDSLEMVRQLFKAAVMQSAFWHRFALTEHSPVGLHPALYDISRTSAKGSFANNDVAYIENDATDHDSFGYGLKKSLLNYMHNIAVDEPLQKWFDFKIPKTTVAPNYIAEVLQNETYTDVKRSAKVVFTGHMPTIQYFNQTKKGRSREMAVLSFETKKTTVTVQVLAENGRWLLALLSELSIYNKQQYTLAAVEEKYEAAGLEDFDLFWFNKPMNGLQHAGLLQL